MRQQKKIFAKLTLTLKRVSQKENKKITAGVSSKTQMLTRVGEDKSMRHSINTGTPVTDILLNKFKYLHQISSNVFKPSLIGHT